MKLMCQQLTDVLCCSVYGWLSRYDDVSSGDESIRGSVRFN